MKKKKLINIVSSFPNQNGVYLFYNTKKTVIYVGKAKFLRNRVLSYFKNKHLKQKKLVDEIFLIEYILVESEQDALFLENNLIKKNQPKYNVLLKDDKTYPWICLTNERFPRLFITRKKNLNGLYFGPYISKKFLKNIYNLIEKYYPLRSCKYNLSEKNINSKKFNVCLEYHLKKCLGPCVGLQMEEDYNKNILSIKKILKGEYSFIFNDLKKKMDQAINNLLFEKADEIKNQLIDLKKLKQKTIIVGDKKISVDSIYIYSFKNNIYINFIRISEGAVVYVKNSKVKKCWQKELILKRFIIYIYTEYGYLSKSIISNIASKNVMNKTIEVPKRGYKKSVLELGKKNIINFIKGDVFEFETLEKMKEDFRLKKIPKHIECFDVSTLQGSNTIGSCVVFKNGKPSKKDYKYFNVGNLEKPDDYFSMKYIIKKRYEKKENLPDLIIVDGGKGQLSVLNNTLIYLKLKTIDTISIAKKNEIIYLKNFEKVVLNKKSKTLNIIKYLRDEAHRFCLKKHIKKREKKLINSELENIKGVGKESIIKLFKKFKSIKKIKETDKKNIIKLLGFKKGVLVFNYFNK